MDFPYVSIVRAAVQKKLQKAWATQMNRGPQTDKGRGGAARLDPIVQLLQNAANATDKAKPAEASPLAISAL